MVRLLQVQSAVPNSESVSGVPPPSHETENAASTDDVSIISLKVT